MSATYSIPDAVTELADLLQAGDIRAARSRARKMLGRGQVRELWLINRLAQELEERPRAVVQLMRELWNSESALDRDKALLKVVAPKIAERARASAIAYGNKKYIADADLLLVQTIGAKDRVRMRWLALEALAVYRDYGKGGADNVRQLEAALAKP